MEQPHCGADVKAFIPQSVGAALTLARSDTLSLAVPASSAAGHESLVQNLAALVAELQRNGGKPVTLQLVDQSGRPMVLQINPRINRVQMVLRADSSEHTADLRDQMRELVQRLKDQGVEAGVTVICRKPQIDDKNLTNNPEQPDQLMQEFSSQQQQGRRRQPARSSDARPGSPSSFADAGDLWALKPDWGHPDRMASHLLPGY